MDPPSFEKSPAAASQPLTPAFSALLAQSQKPASQDLAPTYSENDPRSQASSSQPFSTTFASISLHRSDRLRLLKFPQADINALRAVIKSSWPFGIQKEQKYGGSYEFKLYSNPWRGQGSDAIPSRILMREILAHLFKNGWILHASTDCSKKEFDKDTLMFRKQQFPPPDSEWVAISFNQYDRMRLIGADEELIKAVRQLLQGMRLLQEEFWKDQRLGAKEFKINGYPWRANGEETMSTRLLLLSMLEVFDTHGLSLYASIDQSQGHGEGTSETDSWYCVRDKSWVPGGHVFHR